MTRNRKKMAFYEVIGKTWPKSPHHKTSEQLHPEKSGKIELSAEKPSMPSPQRQPQWPKRPKIVQFNAGRIEISMPYQIAIALLLGIVLLVLVVFRLGQITYLSNRRLIDSATKTQEIDREKPTRQMAASTAQTPDVLELEEVSLDVKKAEPTKPEANNRIVIQTYQLRAHLEPVKQYFARFGIETEIRKIDDWYYLVTKDRYGNPEKPHTDGYLAKQRIIELGAEYKSPPGYETFGTRPFHTAFGKRFDD